MKACGRELFTLKALLNNIAKSIGLRVNYAKSMMTPINVTPDKLELLAATFGYTPRYSAFYLPRSPAGLNKTTGD